jgi:hypothetical protein
MDRVGRVCGLGQAGLWPENLSELGRRIKGQNKTSTGGLIGPDWIKLGR